MDNARTFALQLGALITLYASLGALITLLFSVINIAFPDTLDYYRFESNGSAIRFSIAMLVVFFPAYLILTRFVNTARRKAGGSYLTFTRWIIYLSLLVGGVILLGDLVALINSFLNGELTVRFFLKAAVLAAIIKAAFFYYLMDVRGYWQTHEKHSIYYGGAALVLVIIAIVIGFFHSETPQEVREMRIDDVQVQDLQNIQYRIEEYYRVTNELPESIDVMYSGIRAPQAPEGRTAYRLEVTGEQSYELCATFAAATPSEDASIAKPYMEQNYDWSHGDGEWCFERVVIPATDIR